MKIQLTDLELDDLLEKHGNVRENNNLLTLINEAVEIHSNRPGGIGKYGFSDPRAKLHPDEPYFFLRAQDSLSVDTLEFYASSVAKIEGDSDSLDELIESFEAWQGANKDKVKDPD